MSNRPRGSLLNQLEILAEKAEHFHKLLLDEIRYRDTTGTPSKTLLGLDFDVVYVYLHPEWADHSSEGPRAPDALHLVEALVTTETMPFTILPGSLHEFIQHWSWLLRGDLTIREAANLLRTDPRSLTADRQKTLRAQLLAITGNRNHLIASVRRARHLLTSKGYVDLRDVIGESEELGPDAQFLDIVLRGLETRRPSFKKSHANQCDSVNLSLLFSAIRKRVPLCLVTQSALIHQVFVDAWSSQASHERPPGAVIPPRGAMLKLGLRMASSTSLSDLRSELHAISIHARDSHAAVKRSRGERVKGETIEDAQETEKRLYALLDRIFRVEEKVDLVWTPPAPVVPEDVDLARLAEDALRISDEIRSEIRQMMETVTGAFDSAATMVSSLAQRSLAARDTLPLLTTAATPQPLFIEKLIYVAEGGVVIDKSSRNIAGGNVNAIIDSVDAQMHSSAIAKRDLLAKHIGDFIQAVDRSPLDDSDKQAVVTETANVAQDAAKEGKLLGRAKILWRGIREIIKDVPDLIKLFESISKLW